MRPIQREERKQESEDNKKVGERKRHRERQRNIHLGSLASKVFKTLHIKEHQCFRTIKWQFRHAINSVQFSHSVMSDSLRPHESQHARPPCQSPTLRVHSDSRPSSQWCHPAISSSVAPFSSCPQSLPASESFPMSHLFVWGGQSTGVSVAEPKYSICIRRTDAEGEAPIFWPPDVKNWLIGKDPDAGKDWRQEEKGTIKDDMVEWHHLFDGHEFEQAPGVGDRQASLACCSPRGHKELEMTEWLNWLIYIFQNPLQLDWVHVTNGGGGGLGTKSCLTLSTPWTVCSPLGSFVHGILQAKILE